MGEQEKKNKRRDSTHHHRNRYMGHRVAIINKGLMERMAQGPQIKTSVFIQG